MCTSLTTAAPEKGHLTFHGLRHTCATLLLHAGVPVHVGQERLGHKRIEVTLGIYAYVRPAMQQDAPAN